VFVNSTIKRKLPLEGIRLVLDHLAKTKMIEWKTKEKENFFVFYYNPHEIADLIMKWANSNVKKGKLETLQWISSGEETEETDRLHGMPIEILHKASKILEETGKVQVDDYKLIYFDHDLYRFLNLRAENMQLNFYKTMAI